MPYKSIKTLCWLIIGVPIDEKPNNFSLLIIINYFTVHAMILKTDDTYQSHRECQSVLSYGVLFLRGRECCFLCRKEHTVLFYSSIFEMCEVAQPGLEDCWAKECPTAGSGKRFADHTVRNLGKLPILLVRLGKLWLFYVAALEIR